MFYNLDVWDGYFVEWEQVLMQFKFIGKLVIVFVGDIYNVWYNKLIFKDGIEVGVEFVILGVMLFGMEYYLSMGDEKVKIFVDDLLFFIEDLQYCNFYQCGFMILIVS